MPPLMFYGGTTSPRPHTSAPKGEDMQQAVIKSLRGLKSIRRNATSKGEFGLGANKRVQDSSFGNAEREARSNSLSGFQVVGSGAENQVSKTEKVEKHERDTVCGGVMQRRKEEAAEMQERLKVL